MIGIVGAGAFGTALAVAWAGAGPVALWGRDAAAMEAMAATRTTPRLRGVTLPEAVRPTARLDALQGARILVLAVPMQALGALLSSVRPLAPRCVVAACKGIDLASGRGPVAMIAEALPEATVAILSGPSFAADIAKGLPTALSLGCADAAEGAALQQALSTPVLRLYRTQDVAGVEIGGALKNVVAIACGAAIGAGLGESARAALMTRGMAEIMRLAQSMGARRETLMGLSGLGDLALTCASPQSRNFALGLALGRGEPPPEATTEGVATARAALELGRATGQDLPVTRATVGLTTGDTTVAEAMQALLSRDLTTETDP